MQVETVSRAKLAARNRLLIAASVFLCASATAIATILWTRPEDKTSGTIHESSSQGLLPDRVSRAPLLPSPPPIPATNPGYPSLADLIAMPPDQLAKVDIAVVNLRCAEGLPGAEHIDIPAEIKKIDGWAARVDEQTRTYAYLFRKNADRYQGIEGKYRMDMLTTVLQQDIGIRYDPAQIALLEKQGSAEDTFFDDARNVFLIGLTGRQMGTCASLPVLQAAIGRRLGYPLSLIATSNHWYLQWQGGRTKFNIEATSPGGLMSHPDEYYRHWPRPVSPAEAGRFYYFKPLSARDELAEFLSHRALILMKCGNMLGAVRCQQQAVGVSEHNKEGMTLMFTRLNREMQMRQFEQMQALLDQRDRARASQQTPPFRTNP